MNGSELLVIVLVATVVFGPSKLPMLAGHLGRLFFRINQLKQQATQFWQSQLNEQQLSENQRKADKADDLYDDKISNRKQ